MKVDRVNRTRECCRFSRSLSFALQLTSSLPVCYTAPVFVSHLTASYSGTPLSYFLQYRSYCRCSYTFHHVVAVYIGRSVLPHLSWEPAWTFNEKNSGLICSRFCHNIWFYLKIASIWMYNIEGSFGWQFSLGDLLKWFLLVAHCFWVLAYRDLLGKMSPICLVSNTLNFNSVSHNAL